MRSKLLLIFAIFRTISMVDALESNQKTIGSITEKKSNEEVLENPTLKTLSGSLNAWSLYSSFTYRMSSLDDPLGPERPNIRKTEAKPNLVNMSGSIGLKYRLTKSDNLSLQVGLYSTTPLHSSISTDNQQNRQDFEKNGQEIDADDPTFSYFKTYTIMGLQNVSFFQYQYITRGSFRDFGYRHRSAFSQALAYKISRSFYLASTLTFENYQYDKDTYSFGSIERNIVSQQTQNTFRGNLTVEHYFSKSLSLRAITDLFSYFQLRRDSELQKKRLQQTLSITYFFSRDISFSPSIRFIASDLRDDRTNLGINININL
jgi:hypothetical protein